MEWTVVTVLIALVGLFAVVIPPITKLTKSMTELTVGIKELTSDLTRLENGNKDAHRRIWEHESKQDDTLGDHEKRITILEHEDIKESAKK
jgi:predicted PurR-regulated permease PerM